MTHTPPSARPAAHHDAGGEAEQRQQSLVVVCFVVNVKLQEAVGSWDGNSGGVRFRGRTFYRGVKHNGGASVRSRLMGARKLPRSPRVGHLVARQKGFRLEATSRQLNWCSAGNASLPLSVIILRPSHSTQLRSQQRLHAFPPAPLPRMPGPSAPPHQLPACNAAAAQALPALYHFAAARLMPRIPAARLPQPAHLTNAKPASNAATLLSALSCSIFSITSVRLRVTNLVIPRG